MTADDKKKRPPYFRYAVMNAYNLSLLAGAATVSLATQNWLLGVAAAGAEALWILFAPDSRLLRRAVWDKRHAEELALADKQALDELMRALPTDEAVRCLGMRQKKEQIDRLCVDNPTFTSDLLTGELTKLDQLVRSFIEMAATCNRYLDYLKGIDYEALEKDLRRYAHQVDNLGDGDGEKERRQIAMKNLSVLQARKAKVAEIRQYLVTVRGQQDLIENTFKLLADQIVTMRSPQELSGQLDELIDGVEAVRQTARDTDRILQAIER